MTLSTKDDDSLASQDLFEPSSDVAKLVSSLIDCIRAGLVKVEVTDFSLDDLPPDWGALASHYGPPHLIHFYANGDATLAQICDKRDVDLSRCVAELKEVGKNHENVVISISVTDEPHFSRIRVALQKVALYFHFQEVPVERCVLRMANYRQAHLLEMLWENFTRLLELNVGTPIDDTNVDMDTEQESVTAVVVLWAKACRESLHCLRVYPTLALSQPMVTFLNKCKQLEHLTIAKVCNKDTVWEFPGVRSVEWDGLRMSFIDSDLYMAKNWKRHFPNASVVRCHRLPWDVFIKVVRSCLDFDPNSNVNLPVNFYVGPWKLDIVIPLVKQQITDKGGKVVEDSLPDSVLLKTARGVSLRLLCDKGVKQ